MLSSGPWATRLTEMMTQSLLNNHNDYLLLLLLLFQLTLMVKALLKNTSTQKSSKNACLLPQYASRSITTTWYRSLHLGKRTMVLYYTIFRWKVLPWMEQTSHKAENVSMVNETPLFIVFLFFSYYSRSCSLIFDPSYLSQAFWRARTVTVSKPLV